MQSNIQYKLDLLTFSSSFNYLKDFEAPGHKIFAFSKN